MSVETGVQRAGDEEMSKIPLGRECEKPRLLQERELQSNTSREKPAPVSALITLSCNALSELTFLRI